VWTAAQASLATQALTLSMVLLLTPAQPTPLAQHLLLVMLLAAALVQTH
jgi:hypothetical protein